MNAPTVNDVRVFVPAKDFELCKNFYQALGWAVIWSDQSIAVMENADQRFYLQNFYVKEWAENFMLHISVDDTAKWRDHVAAMIDSGDFPGVRVAGPKREPYGAIVTFVWDPSGVLLHFAEWDRDGDED